jgi:Domain of unknown function (DUF4350)
MRETLRRSRVWIVIVLLVLGTAVVVGLAGAKPATTPLDPASYEPSGSHALASLLRNQGVDVTSTSTADPTIRDASADSTLFITQADLVPRSRLQQLASAGWGRIVMIAPTDPGMLQIFAPSVSLSDTANNGYYSVGSAQPGCTWHAASIAGDVDLGGLSYTNSESSGVSCYPVDGNPTLVAGPEGDNVSWVVLGDGSLFRNDRLGNRGNASLSLSLLGAHQHVVWYIPTLGDPALEGQGKSVTDLLPTWVKWVALELLLAAVVLALARMRRLGRVVVEPLPVIVRASETTEGRGRLYASGRARGHAAHELREASRQRLRRRLGGAAEIDDGALVSTVSARTSLSDADIAEILYGQAPPDDHALVTLADTLDQLEAEVLRT